MPASLADQLEAIRQQHFVGRTTERNLFHTASRPGCSPRGYVQIAGSFRRLAAGPVYFPPANQHHGGPGRTQPSHLCLVGGPRLAHVYAHTGTAQPGPGREFTKPGHELADIAHKIYNSFLRGFH